MFHKNMNTKIFKEKIEELGFHFKNANPDLVLSNLIKFYKEAYDNADIDSKVDKSIKNLEKIEKQIGVDLSEEKLKIQFLKNESENVSMLFMISNLDDIYSKVFRPFGMERVGNDQDLVNLYDYLILRFIFEYKSYGENYFFQNHYDMSLSIINNNDLVNRFTERSINKFKLKSKNSTFIKKMTSLAMTIDISKFDFVRHCELRMYEHNGRKGFEDKIEVIREQVLVGNNTFKGIDLFREGF